MADLLNVTYGNFHHENHDGDEAPVIFRILEKLTRLILYQFEAELKDDPNINLHAYEIKFLTNNQIKACGIRGVNAKKPHTDSFVLNGVTIHTFSYYSGTKFMVETADRIHAKDFEGLAAAKIMDADPQSLENWGFTRAVFDLRLLDEKYIQSVRNDILKRIYQSVSRIYKAMSFDNTHIKAAYHKVKKMPWYVEFAVGDPVFSRGKTRKKAQLIARYKNHFRYLIARIFDDENKNDYRDVVFDITWNPGRISSKPGRLVWASANILRFNNHYKENGSDEFQIDGDPLKFPFYEKPWEKPRIAEINVYVGEWLEKDGGVRRLNFRKQD